MKFAYTIIYVADVAASLAFYQAAFGLSLHFLHESGMYGELATGDTKLAFAAHDLAELNFAGGHVRADQSQQVLGMEIGLVCEDVAQAHQQALAAGATELSAPQQKPWGQTVSYLRCPDGSLVELCTAMS